MPVLLGTSVVLSFICTFLPIAAYLLNNRETRSSPSNEAAEAFDVMMINSFFISAPRQPPENLVKGKPASQQAMDNLLVITSAKIQTHICCICHNDLDPHIVTRQMPCGHYFHQSCIFTWLSVSNTCPLCRYEIDTNNETYNGSLHRRMAKHRPLEATDCQRLH